MLTRAGSRLNTIRLMSVCREPDLRLSDSRSLGSSFPVENRDSHVCLTRTHQTTKELVTDLHSSAAEMKALLTVHDPGGSVPLGGLNALRQSR